MGRNVLRAGDGRRCVFGAGDRVRTGDIDLGKVALYQLSYSRSEAYSTFCNDIVVKSIHLTATRRFRAFQVLNRLWRSPHYGNVNHFKFVLQCVTLQRLSIFFHDGY